MKVFRNRRRFFKLATIFIAVTYVLASSAPAFAQTGTGTALQFPFYDPDYTAPAGGCSIDLVGSVNAEKLWNFLTSAPQNLTPIQAAGIMGNLKVESGFNPKRVEDGWGFPSEMDTIPPGAGPQGQPGYGIAQWTSPGRKQGLSDFANSKGAAVNDLGLQANWLWAELTKNYTSTYNAIKGSDDLAFVSATFGHDYEGFGTDTEQDRLDAASGVLATYGSNVGAGQGGISTCAGSMASSGSCSVNGVATTTEYTDQQLVKIFGPQARSNPSELVDTTFFGDKVTVNKVIVGCLKAVEQDILSHNISYRPVGSKGGIGCYRATDGQVGDRSYHVYGAACDINPNTNNYFSSGVPRPYNPDCPVAAGVVDSGNCYDMPPEVVAAFARHGFYWGGNFNSIKDYMHFEWHGVKP